MAKNKILGIRRAGSSETFRSPKTATVSEIFGCDVLTIEKMRQYLSIESFQRNWKGDDRRWDDRRGLADQVAAAMKAWAVEREQPITLTGFIPNGATAEKQWVY